MPRVVPDQKNKYDTDELFKKLSQDVDVKYTGYRDRPMDERKRKFMEDLQEGHSVITFIATGTNLNLQFCRHALQDEKPANCRPTREAVDFEREPGKVYLYSSVIFNGVCVNWIGCMDLDSLTGKAKLAYNEEMAKAEDEIMRKVLKETQDRVRMFEEKQRRWQQDQLQSPVTQ